MAEKADAPRRPIAIALHQPGVSDRSLHRLLLDHDIDPSASTYQADVLLADLRQEAETRLLASATRLRDATPSKPLLFLIEAEQLEYASVQSLAEKETLIVSSKSEQALIAEITRRALDVDRAAEAAIRVQTMSAVGLGTIPPSQAPNNSSALLVAPPGPMALDLSSTLSAHTDLETVMSRQQALSALELGGADRIFILPDTNRRPMAAMIRLLRRHTELSALPIIVFERQPTDRHRDYWARSGADMVLSTAQAALAVTVCRQRWLERNAHMSVLRLLRHASFTDLGEQSRLCAPRFFEAALELRCASKLPFTLGAMRLKPHQAAEGPHIFTEPSIYVALGMKSSDLITRAAPDLLLMSFAGADLHHAKRNLMMLSTLVHDLKFGTQQAPTMFGTQTYAQSAPQGSDPRKLIRETIRGLTTLAPIDALFA